MDGGSWVDGMQALVERLGCGALSGDGKDWLVSQILQDILCVGGGGCEPYEAGGTSLFSWVCCGTACVLGGWVCCEAIHVLGGLWW